MPGDSLYGKFWQAPILNIKDSSLFYFDGVSWRYMYNYSLIVPLEKATDEILEKIMKQDLKNYFGYDVVLKKKKMPYWRGRCCEFGKNEFKNKGATPNLEHNIESSESGIRIINQPLYLLIFRLYALNQNEPPFLDETGIKGNIDIQLDGDLGNFSVLKKNCIKKGSIL
ncbi:MAG: hypothetical protein WDM78_13945 [Puia sp.]